MKNFLQFSFLSIIMLVVSCSKEENTATSTTSQLTTNDKINAFIWKGLNTYYYWQKDVPNLADTRFKTNNELHLHFRNYSTPKASFESLLNKPADRFSWIVDDYVALENSFQGTSQNNGMEFGLIRNKTNTSNVFGYVRYVIPNTSAASRGVKRGMIFNAIDGTQLTNTNYNNLLFGQNSSYTVNFADYNAGDPTANGTDLSLTKAQVSENPIAISKVFDEGTKKIGYLMYNQFSNAYDSQLNAAFGNFKSQGINELIVDLRYNGGGSAKTATYLGAMITGQFDGKIYSKQVWNQKVHDATVDANNFITNFTNEITRDGANEPINNLKLTKIYFIVSGSSASASELVINSLNPYIDVKVVGNTTVGKQVGSITLYDSKNLQKTGENLNTEHKYAMQPLVLEIKNSKDQNYPEGITPGTPTGNPKGNIPGVFLKEDYGNLGVLGEKSDPLLARTIQLILTGGKSRGVTKNPSFETVEIYNSKLALPSKNNMYFELNQ